jgi:hypothetical protein
MKDDLQRTTTAAPQARWPGKRLKIGAGGGRCVRAVETPDLGGTGLALAKKIVDVLPVFWRNRKATVKTHAEIAHGHFRCAEKLLVVLLVFLRRLEK